MEIKALEVIKNGKRNVKLANYVRGEMYNKIAEILADAGFVVENAANGDIAILTCTDVETGANFYTRLSVSFSNKALDAKVEKKVKEKAPEVELPDLF